MSPELEAALEPIGWHQVKQEHPYWAHMLAQQFNSTGGRIEANANLSAKRAQELANALGGLEAVVVTLEQIEGRWRDSINQTAELRLTQQECKVGDRIAEAVSLLQAIKPGLELMYSFALDESEKSNKRGPARNEAAYRIARTVAEIYVSGTGNRPTYGKDEYSGEINTAFGRAVANVLKVLEVSADPEKPSRWARDSITDEEFERLRACFEYREEKAQFFEDMWRGA